MTSRTAPVVVRGLLMGRRREDDGTSQEIVFIEEEQRSLGGPAAASMISVRQEPQGRVGQYVPWINYYDLDEASRREPGRWEIVDPATTYAESVVWLGLEPPATGTSGTAEAGPGTSADELSRLHDLVARLSRTPQEIRQVLEHLGHRAGVRPAPGEWSATEIVVHVVSADAILAPRVIQIALHPGVALPALDERAWGGLIQRSGIPIGELVVTFGRQRDAWTALVASLRAEEVTAAGKHEQLGVVSVLDTCESLAEHEAEHLRQLRDLAGPVPGS
jgi:hypothetical protein